MAAGHTLKRDDRRDARPPLDGQESPGALGVFGRLKKRLLAKPGEATEPAAATPVAAAAPAVGPDGRVDSFEPSPSLRRKLTEAVHRSHAVAIVIHPKLVGTQAQ